MPTAIIDGITTRYEVVGSGPPLLMYAPAGFDASLDKWTTQGIYAKIKPLEHLSKTYSCIVFDRRECGGSGGRVERVTWAHYVAQGKGLLEHLGINVDSQVLFSWDCREAAILSSCLANANGSTKYPHPGPRVADACRPRSFCFIRKFASNAMNWE